ncbi:hypothetical protein KPH14_012842 [Odynerus spinipes]|uniref:Uncharacterized protein n=1 Tax=Odynerus spinipes TaxID=1348599 RepID=A0AAD9RDL5_9HYME|nr:hypothetical protein KPH14_012842 [Odynerus spinipes]
MVPRDHLALVGFDEGYLKRKFRVKFDDPRDRANRVRQFLIRENALEAEENIDNPAAKYAKEVSREKRLQALKALQSPAAGRALDEVLRERPELNEGQEVKIVIPSIYKKGQNKST